MNIVPMRDLKDTVRIEQLCAGDNGPVFVTKNGYGRLVVMDIEYFEKTMKRFMKPVLSTKESMICRKAKRLTATKS